MCPWKKHRTQKEHRINNNKINKTKNRTNKDKAGIYIYIGRKLA